MYSTGSHANTPLECLIEPHLVIDISSSEIGVLDSMPVDTADEIEKNDIVAALRTEVEHAALAVSRTRASAKSEIELLENDHNFYRRKSDRFSELQDKRMISEQDSDQVQAEQEAAWLRLKAANEKLHRTKLEAARDELALARRTVLSPINGVVVKQYKKVGEYVDGDPILQLAQLDPLRIEVVVPITRYNQIQVGMQATILPELPIDGPFTATVTNIDPIMDAATATFGVRLSLPNPDHRLPAGLKCTLILHSVDEPPAAAAHPTETEKESIDTKPPGLEPMQKTSTSGDCDSTKQTSSSPPCRSTNVSPSDEEPMAEESMVSDSDDQKESGTVSLASCTTIGPFIDVGSENQLTALLTNNDLTFARRYENKADSGSPWMVLSNQTYTNPDDLVNALRAAGIRDIQWFKSGPWKHRFSYGFFRDGDNAQARAAKLKTLGFNAEIVPSRSKDSTLWLDLSTGLDDPALSSINAGSTYLSASASLLPMPCPSEVSD